MQIGWKSTHLYSCRLVIWLFRMERQGHQVSILCLIEIRITPQPTRGLFWNTTSLQIFTWNIGRHSLTRSDAIALSLWHICLTRDWYRNGYISCPTTRNWCSIKFRNFSIHWYLAATSCNRLVNVAISFELAIARQHKACTHYRSIHRGVFEQRRGH